MDEFKVEESLLEKRKNIKTEKDLFDFITDVRSNYNYGYGVAPRSIAQAGIATMNYLLNEMGCTGFQASCAAWGVITDFFNINTGAKIIRYDDMLYPQYEYKFREKTISRGVWNSLQKEAKNNLEKDNKYASPNVIKHWESIIEGIVPFGYKVED